MARAITRTLPSPSTLLAPVTVAAAGALWAGKLVVGRALDVVLMIAVGVALLGLALVALPLATFSANGER